MFIGTDLRHYSSANNDISYGALETSLRNIKCVQLVELGFCLVYFRYIYGGELC